MPNRPAERESETISLSPVNPDPVASMRMWGSMVALGETTFKVPALDAAAWLELLLADPIVYEDLFPGLAGPETVLDVNQMILRGEVSGDDLEQAITDLIEAVSGRRWWITLRLCQSLRANWESVGGELARHGVTPFKVPLSYWLDAAYSTMVELFLKGPKPRKVQEWNRALTTPPPSEGRQIDEEANSLAFLAAMRKSR